MKNRNIMATIAIAGLMFAVGYLAGRATSPHSEPSKSGAGGFGQTRNSVSGSPGPAPDHLPDAAERAAGVRRSSSLEALLSNGEPPTPLSPEAVEAYVRLNNANAQSLLAAFETSKEMQWLREAAEKHADDMRVMFAVINFGDDSIPGNRKEWLEKLSQAAPDNALVDYLSATEFLKRKNPEGAIQALLNADGKTAFEDYTMHTIQSAEEMHNRAGRSPAEAKAMAGVQTRLPHLQELRNLGREMVKLYESHKDSGDLETANAIAAAGLNMGRHMSVGTGNRYLVNELVGIATEKVFLDALDPAVEHAFLDRPLAELQDELDKQRNNIKTVAKSVRLEKMSDSDVIAYFDRVKLYGEFETMKWFYEQGAGR